MLLFLKGKHQEKISGFSISKFYFISNIEFYSKFAGEFAVLCFF